MILNRPADQEVYEYLIDNYYKDFSITEISKAIKKSIPMIYKSVSMLKKREVVKEKGTRYKVDLLSEHTLHYKYLYDYEKFLALPDSYKNKILELKWNLRSIMPQNIRYSLIIFGSLADGTFDKESDIDILLILSRNFNALATQLPDGFHFLLKECVGFLKEISAGDDIALSICKAHIIVKDETSLFIRQIKENKNKVDENIIKFRKNEARNLKTEIITMYSENKRDEIAKKLILEKLQKLIKIEAKIICLENNIIPTSKMNSFQEASKILKRNIKKEYEDINIGNVFDKVKSYV